MVWRSPCKRLESLRLGQEKVPLCMPKRVTENSLPIEKRGKTNGGSVRSVLRVKCSPSDCIGRRRGKLEKRKGVGGRQGNCILGKKLLTAKKGEEHRPRQLKGVADVP